MKVKILLVTVVATLCLHAKAQTPVSVVQAEILQQKLDSCVNTYNIPGISATILLPENKYWNGASGLSNIYTLDSMTTDHLFYQASVTKMFVATVIFQLIEQNLLSLDDSVGQYLPPIPTVPSSTKIRYLLNHRSGLYDVFSNNVAAQNWYNTPNAIWNPLTVIQTYSNNPTFSQGTGFSYSNTNYMLLGLIIEQITGNSFAQALTDQILTPYNLNNTFFLPQQIVTGTITPGWTSFSSSNTYDTNASSLLTNCFASMVFTSGALISYPQDVAKFNRLLFSGQIISDSSLTIMKTCTNVNLGNNANGYGHGFMRYNFAGKTYYGHAGDINGFTQLTIHQETDSITLAISINRNNAPRGPIALAMLNALKQALTVGINEPALTNNGFNIYPNPSCGNVNIELKGLVNTEKKIELYNQVGQIVHEEKMNNVTNNTSIDLENFPNGIYFLKVSDGLRRETKKLIIQH
ncbi:MAG: serine hydrolase [Bacteroidetes bacterium]|nr:serine hydrolase [Bacteroidota bacterium]